MDQQETRRTNRVVRASISVPARTYEELERIAVSKKVSVAWVVREAIERYLDEPGPLFRKNQSG